MKVCVILFGIFLVLLACIFVDGGHAGHGVHVPYYDLKYAPNFFAKFIKEYHRNYKNTADMLIHYEAFKNNLKKINRLNSMRKTSSDAFFGITDFADNTKEEQNQHFGVGTQIAANADAKAAADQDKPSGGDTNTIDAVPEEVFITSRNVITVPNNCPPGYKMGVDGVCREVF